MLENLYIVNAFTAKGKNGNPAGVILRADDLDEQRMLAIAASAGLSETAFVSESNCATHRVRFFTPIIEEPLCGHATIATWSLLHKLGKLKVGTFTQETQAGLLKVEIQDDGLVFMEQAKVVFSEEIAPTEIANLLGITEDDFHATLLPKIVSTGIKDLLVPLANKSVLAKLQANLDGVADFSRRHGISGFHAFALLNESKSVASARNFAPADGIAEECATGTSNGALLCYLKDRNSLPERDIYRIEQGQAMGRLSHIYGTFRDGIVWVGGEAEVEGARSQPHEFLMR
jgi:PhzF family phenazine biosynthesis protein